jgi:hypothetical protein
MVIECSCFYGYRASSSGRKLCYISIAMEHPNVSMSCEAVHMLISKLCKVLIYNRKLLCRPNHLAPGAVLPGAAYVLHLTANSLGIAPLGGRYIKKDSHVIRLKFQIEMLLVQSLELS